jgi:serine protease Do
VNSKGELVGINSAIASNTGSYSGYSFAIPVNIVRKVVADLLEYGDVQRAFIGVVLEDLDAKLASKKGIENIKGVYVAGLNAGGAAEEAGIKQGDVILKVQDAVVNNLPELQEQVGRYRPGDKVDITVSRDGSVKVIPVVLKNKNGDTRLIRYTESVAIELGAEFIAPTDKEKSSLRLDKGLKVAKLKEGKLKRIGIREGIIITHIGDKAVDTVEDLTNALKSERRGMLIEGIYPNGTRAYYGLGI